MGYPRHHAIIVSTWNRERLNAARVEAMAAFGPRMVSGVVESVVNEEYTFLVGPDGSQENFQTSEMYDIRRAAFVGWLNSQRDPGDDGSLLDWVEVQYGDGDGDTRVVSDTDEHFRRSQSQT